MPDTRTDIIAQLKKDILPLTGFKPLSGATSVNPGWGRINDAFPGKTFPLGAIHEFLCTGLESAAASSGFMAVLIASLMKNRGACLWISPSRTLFPPGLKNFGIDPDRVIFVDLQKEKDIAWAMEEALKCGALAAVVGEVHEISFTASRRLQLAVEQSQVTGFIFRRNPWNINTTACVTRWKVTSLPSEAEDGLPGPGFPRWNVELLKVRNGNPGSWQVEWTGEKFRHISTIAAIIHKQQRKTG
jgi:protein ImuA